jgi:hypothetical protein
MTDNEKARLIAAMLKLADQEDKKGKLTTEPPKNRPLLLTVKDSATYVGISRGIMHRLLKQGRIVPIEVLPGMKRIRTADLDRLVMEESR